MAYLAEYTDTFGGEANYCWVNRATVSVTDLPDDLPRAKEKRIILARARKELGLTGVKGDITADFGDEWHWVPRGSCTILMVRWDDSPEALTLQQRITVRCMECH